jgi:hypothetical protein
MVNIKKAYENSEQILDSVVIWEHLPLITLVVLLY